MKIIYLLTFLLISQLFGSSEYKVKSVYVYNIAKFVKWDHKTFLKKDSSFNIAIYGDGDIYEYMKVLESKKILNHQISITNINDLNNIGKYHIIYVAKDKQDKLNNIKQAINKKTILIASDIRDFAKKGGHIEIRTIGKRLKLFINNYYAKQNNIQFSSKLLKLATIVDSK